MMRSSEVNRTKLTHNRRDDWNDKMKNVVQNETRNDHKIENWVQNETMNDHNVESWDQEELTDGH